MKIKWPSFSDRGVIAIDNGNFNITLSSVAGAEP